MQAKSTYVRILRILGKSILALLVVLVGFILLLHIPFIQRPITQQLPGYLSDHIDSKIEIEHIRFSLLGCTEIQGLKVWDPGDNLILSLDTLNLETNFLDLIKGDFRLRKLELTGVNSRVTQDQNEAFNFQFILDAFGSNELPDTSSSSVQLHCDSLILKDLDFTFQSMGDEMMLKARIGDFVGTNILVSTDPLMFYADSIFVNRHQVAVLSKTIDRNMTEVTSDSELKNFNLNVDLGFGLNVKTLTLKEHNFSFHADTVLQTSKFDQDHIVVDNVNLKATDIVIDQGHLNINIKELMAQTPGFELSTGRGEIGISKNGLSVSGMALSTSHSYLNAEGKIENSPDGILTPNVVLASKGQIALEDFAYFLSDSLEEIMSQWPLTSFIFELSPLNVGKQNVVLNINTPGSHLDVSGAMEHILDFEKLGWEDLNIHSRIGADLRSLLSNFVGDANLPPDMMVASIKSSGNRSKINLDGSIETAWGNVMMKGGFAPVPSGLDVDMHLSSSNLMLKDFLETPWLGPVDLSISMNGSLGANQNLFVESMISEIEFSDKIIHQIQWEGHLWKDSLTAAIIINDPDYTSRIHLNGDLRSPMKFDGMVQLDSFMLGQLLSTDSSLSISGDLKADVILDQATFEAHIDGVNLLASNNDNTYFPDSLRSSVYLSPDSSLFEYWASDGKIDLLTNFDLRESEQAVDALTAELFYSGDSLDQSDSRTFSITARLDDPGILLLAGMDIDSFSSIQVKGSWVEEDHFIELDAYTGLFSSFGIKYDTLAANISMSKSGINAEIKSENLFYNAFEIGDMEFDLTTTADTSESHLQFAHDSINLLSLDTRLLVNEEGIVVIPGDFILYNQQYQFHASNPLMFVKNNVIVSGLTLAREDMKITLDGDLNAFDLNFENIDLSKLDPILFQDATVIDSGRLNGKMSFIRDQQLNLVAKADNLILLHSDPLTIDVRAETKESNVPFEMMVSNGESNISLTGSYGMNRRELDAELQMNIKDLREFRAFYQETLDDLQGSVTGEAKISGALENPDVSGYLQFGEVDFSLKNPKLSFAVKNDRVAFDHHGVVFTDFVIYDNLDNPLQISGAVQNKEYTSYAYDLNIKTDHYALINRPENTSEHLNGLLVVGTNIHLKGNAKDTYVSADILIKDTTKLILNLPDKKNELLNTDGIIEFVEANHLLDSSLNLQQGSTYDSLIARLPDFSLTSKVIIEEEAGLTIHIDPASGDYFSVTGKASLDLMYDRTGNPMLNGTYEVADGVYSLSFYDLVKKDFKLVKGSSVKWSGGPEDGVLDIKAAYYIQSNSIGLVGQEVSESEKSVYKKSLVYEVSINISGTIMQPEISFSLDLPDEDKITYPALANKLSRLKQPEFQSELNKQVFGLLVLGSFLPETSEADGGQSDIATTALYNSVNSVLAAQLNKLAGQYIKGVNIDVGIQSYSDYSSNGGKTKTSMDFRVSKSLMDDRLVFEVGGDFDIGADQSGANQGKSYRTDVAIIYDLTGNGDKKLKLFNNESYDIIYQEIRNTGISLIFIKEFDKGELKKKKGK